MCVRSLGICGVEEISQNEVDYSKHTHRTKWMRDRERERERGNERESVKAFFDWIISDMCDWSLRAISRGQNETYKLNLFVYDCYGRKIFTIWLVSDTHHTWYTRYVDVHSINTQTHTDVCVILY